METKACGTRLLLTLFLFVLTLSACAAPTTGPTTTTPPSPTAQTQASMEPLPETVATTGQALGPTPTTLMDSPLPTAQIDRIRPSALAGSWYPADPDQLAAMVDSFLDAVEPVDGEPTALIVPHAGYVYSGPVAAYGFKQMAQGDYEVAVIIAADHQLPLSDPISVWTEGGFETPLGVVPVDVELAEALVASDPRIGSDIAPHQGEHPIEIELPFLQRVCPDCRIVPVLMGTADEESVAALSHALLSILPGQQAVLIASSDLSHYSTYQEALAVDGATLAAIEAGDPAGVQETIRKMMTAGYSNLATCACGEGPILVTMRVAKGLGANTITVLRYANSGDSPYGDRERVVGYGAVMFWRYTPPDLTPTQRLELLSLARTAIEEYLETGEIPDYEPADPVLVRRSGAFVTLRQGDQLRGCIGRLWADQPLYQRVQEMAVAAATSDPRFLPLTIDELDEVDIEISVLSPLRLVTDTRQIEVGSHGLVIHHAGQQGVLLPQVPVENGWDRDEFLENLCLKVGLPQGCWKDRPTLYTFTAVVFGEAE